VTMTSTRPHIIVDDLRIGWGSHVLMEHVDFQVERGTTFAILGGSGSGKSTLLRYLIGLDRPKAGRIDIDGVGSPHVHEGVPPFGVLFQSGALFSSMTLAENVGMPLAEYTSLSPAEVLEIASLKLALVGLKGFEDFYPSQLSGGMVKRAGLARAMALDPKILFFDEPSAGLDPISSRLLDDLILELRDSLDATIVIVTHELASIFAIGTNSVFLDVATRTIAASGPPQELRDHSDNPSVRRFLTRGADVRIEGGSARG